MTGELYISNFKVDLSGDIPFPFSYSVADIKEPNQRKRNSSKQVALPGTNKNKSFFASAYNMSLSALESDSIGFDFDPTIKYSAYYKEEGELIFIGQVQLIQVEIENGNLSFIIVLYSNFVDLFQALRDIKVSELGWSEYSHTLSVTNIQNSWSTSVIKNGSPVSNFTGGIPDGFGYLYPIADYGYSSDLQTYLTNNIYPHIYLREFFTKCFEIAGFSISGNFIDSDLVRKIVMGFGGGPKQNLNAAEISNRQSKYTATGSYSATYNYSSYVQQNTYFGTTYIYYFLFTKFLNINDSFWSTATTVTDNLSQFDETTGDFLIAKTGIYSINFTGDIDFQSDITGPTTGCALIVEKNGVQIGALNTTNSIGIQNFNSSFNFSAVAGDVIAVKFKLISSPTIISPIIPENILDKNISLDNVGTWTIDLRSLGGTPIDGDTIYLENYIPDIKAADLLFGFITAFNLYVDDPDFDNTVSVETLDDFYEGSNTAENWSDLVDRSKKIVILPASQIKGKEYVFKFAEDNDYYNKRYRDTYGIGYGDLVYTVQSTFEKGQRVYELPFAQTVPVEVPGTNIVIPTIISIDNISGAVSPYKGKPRVYIYSGLRNSDSWKLVNSATNVATVYTSYPVCNHLDDLDNPTFDFNFRLPEVLEWSNANYVNINLFSEFYEKPLRETTGKDSKIIRVYLKLNKSHVKPGSFKKLKNIDGVLYRLNEIKDYNGNGEETTFTELVRIVEGSRRRPIFLEVPHDVSNIPRESGGDSTNGTSSSPALSTGEKDSIDILAPVERG